MMAGLMLPVLFLITGCCFIAGSVISDQYNENICNRLQSIRKLMNDSATVGEIIEAYVLPMSDAHQSEYISEKDKRIQYMTRFSGSAGTIVITQNEALLWTDSRYHIQAGNQVDSSCWTVMEQGLIHVPDTPTWLGTNLPSNSRIGVDPFIFSSSAYKKLEDGVHPKGHNLIPILINLVDKIWEDRDESFNMDIYPIPQKYTGQRVKDKLKNLRVKIAEKDAEAIIITALDELAWMFNLRGSDIPYNPVFFGYAIVTLNTVRMCVHKNRIGPDVINHLANEGVYIEFHPYEDILKGISETLNNITGKVLITDDASYAIYDHIPESKRIQVPSIIARMKTIKNKVEAEGIRRAHIRDGVALIRYLHWLDSTIDKENVTEVSGAKRLEEFRSEEEYYKGLSFKTISAVGSNAAMAHYETSDETNRQITRLDVYLVDSGGQYWDGTTDVTRTMHFGSPSSFEKKCFTRVLKGFIGFVTSVFPINTAFSYFNFMARRYLWEAGLDYGHGTGHGIGAFLGVHEYPPLITSRSDSNPGAQENMFTSDEPGYYNEGVFGIRIEDIIQVVKADISNAFNGAGALTFKTITYAPIQTKMIDTTLLSREEEKYINKYHHTVLSTIGPILLERDLIETYNWLVKETKPLD